ncbi:MAG: hypothetical protein M3P32_05555 [Chloroflexota bacterium]|nr:hypothetical protein [Chloroflexota bacterium]
MPFRKSKPVQLAAASGVVVALVLTALVISRPPASPPASGTSGTALPLSPTAIGTLSPSASASQAASASQVVSALPDPCSLLTSSDVQSYIDGINDGIWGYRDFSGPANERDSCFWNFEQYLLATGDLTAAARFFVSALTAPDSSCEAFVGAGDDRIAVAGIGDCAFTTGHSGAGVIVGDVYAFAGLAQGGTPATGATLRAIEAELATRLAAALAP